MFRNNARKLVIALSLFAAVGSILPGSHVAAAAPILAAESVGEVRLEPVEQVKPRPHVTFNKGSVIQVSPWVTHSGKTTYYHFKVQAEYGELTAATVTSIANFRKVASNNTGYHASAGSSTESYYLGILYAPSYHNVIVACIPPPDAFCSSAVVNVTTANLPTFSGVNDTAGYTS